MDDEYTKRRHELERQLLEAANNLLTYTRAAGAVLPIEGTDPPSVIAIGEPEWLVDQMMLNGSLR